MAGDNPMQRRYPVFVKCLPVKRWRRRTSQGTELAILHERIQALGQTFGWLGERAHRWYRC